MIQHNEQDLELFKAKLLQIKAKDETQLEETKLQLKTLAENGREENGLDNTSYSTQFEHLIEYQSRLIKHLRQVENALMRITNNCYGICSKTGKLIDKNRLLAVPTTTQSMEGKSTKK